MSINSISGTSVTDTYIANTAAKDTVSESKDKQTADSTATTQATSAAVYDKTKLSEDDRKAIVSQLKADQEKREAQFTNLVKDMMSKQTTTYGQANSIWEFLAKGDYTVDALTQEKAKEAIAEDGYWGVEQTSDRIVSFATALAGNDSSALEKMRDAFIKGYEQAEKQWGGKLPDISQKTYDAVMEKFDKLTNPSSEDKESSSEDGTVIIKKDTEVSDPTSELTQ